MKLDDEAAMVLDLMKKSGRPTLDSLDAKTARAQADGLAEKGEMDAPEVARVQDGTLSGPNGPIPFRRYWPMGATAKTLPTLIYYHGGGFVIGTLETHDSTCRRMCNVSGLQVIAIDYRLAPEHPFPVPVDDAVAAFKHIAANAAAFDTQADKLAVGGDSAGGNLAAVICQVQKQSGGAMPSFQLLIYPATDNHSESASRRELGDGYFLTTALMKWFFDHYAPKGVDRTDPRISPLFTRDLSGLPPAFVLTAGFDPLRDEGKAYAERLMQAGIKVTYTNYPGTIHGFFSLTRFLKQGVRANDEAGYALKLHFSEG